MKTPKRFNGRFLSIILAIVLAITFVPLLPEQTRADWKDDLWSVYSQMTDNGSDQESIQPGDEDASGQKQSESQSGSKNKSKKSKKSKKKNSNNSNNNSNNNDNKDSKKNNENSSAEDEAVSLEDIEVDKKGEYTSKLEVAAYIHQYGKLPSNFITKNQAKKLGWDNKAGNLAKVAPGKSIGGDHFGNYEGQLPEKKGRDYYECDIDYEKGYRSEKRIIFSDDGMIFYTEDHYETFDQLWPEE